MDPAVLTTADLCAAMQKLREQTYQPRVVLHEQRGADGRCLVCGANHKTES